jgi:hypothetical protein
MLPGAASSVALDTLLGFTRFCAGTIDNINAFSDTQILALLNQKQKELQTFILSEVLNDWKEDTLEGTGNGLINLVDSQNYYSFPTDMLTLDRVEINYNGAENNWSLAQIRPEQAVEVGLANTAQDNILVGSYEHPVVWARNGKIYIDPIPYQSVTSGLKVYCSVVTTDLTVDGTAPTFVKAFHDIICRMSALEWLANKDKGNKFKNLWQVTETRKADMVRFYLSREQDGRRTMTPSIRNYK